MSAWSCGACVDDDTGCGRVALSVGGIVVRVVEWIWVKCIVDMVIGMVGMVIASVLFVWSCRCHVFGGGCIGCDGGSWCGYCGSSSSGGGGIGSASSVVVAAFRRCPGGNRCRFVIVFLFVCYDRTHVCGVAYAHGHRLPSFPACRQIFYLCVGQVVG